MGKNKPDTKGVRRLISVLGRQKTEKVLEVKFDNDGKRPVEVSIRSSSQNPDKGKIVIGITGMRSRLELSKVGPVLHNNDYNAYLTKETTDSKNVNIGFENLVKYWDRLSDMKRQLDLVKPHKRSAGGSLITKLFLRIGRCKNKSCLRLV